MFNEEYHIQTALIHWLRLVRPEVLFTIAPNGMKLPIGVAKKIKAMGYNKGCPDIMIFEAKKNYCGLFIELKTKTGKIQTEQKVWLDQLSRRGYKAIVCRSCEEAIVAINDYMK